MYLGDWRQKVCPPVAGRVRRTEHWEEESEPARDEERGKGHQGLRMSVACARISSACFLIYPQTFVMESDYT